MLCPGIERILLVDVLSILIHIRDDFILKPVYCYSKLIQQFSLLQ